MKTNPKLQTANCHLPSAFRRAPLRLCASVVILLACGCVQTSFKLADGTSFKTSRLLWTGNIGEASITNTNGTSAGLKTYTSENAQVAEAIARGVAAGIK